MSPTERSLKLLREEGYLVAVVEKWNSFVKVRQDLFGFIDLLAIKENETLAVQTTSGDNVSARLTKIEASDNLPIVRKANWRIEVHGWRKNAAGRWVLRRVDVS